MRAGEIQKLEQTGAAAGSVLRGVFPNNRGLRLRVLDAQTKGNGGPVVGDVVLLDGGDNKHRSVLAQFLNRVTRSTPGANRCPPPKGEYRVESAPTCSGGSSPAYVVSCVRLCAALSFFSWLCRSPCANRRPKFEVENIHTASRSVDVLDLDVFSY
jgi:hypothetical protein